MIDTHCHLTFPQFRDRVREVVNDAAERGVHGAITVSTTTSDAGRALAIAKMLPNVWSTAGVHPLNCDEPIAWADLLAAARDEKCVAWGELGLDHHYAEPPRDLQNRVLHEQLEVIAGSGISLPVIVHCRDAFDDLIPIFRSSGLPPERFVFHCFTGDEAAAKKVLDFGAWISFTGIVTFKNAKAIQAAAKIVPDDRIMIETDAPFLTPEPHRKVRPNEPKFAIDTARFVAELRGAAWEHFHSRINENTVRFFGLPAETVR